MFDYTISQFKLTRKIFFIPDFFFPSQESSFVFQNKNMPLSQMSFTSKFAGNISLSLEKFQVCTKMIEYNSMVSLHRDLRVFSHSLALPIVKQSLALGNWKDEWAFSFESQLKGLISNMILWKFNETTINEYYEIT